MNAKTKREIRDTDQEMAFKTLRRLRPGTTIYFVVTHVSVSGMSRSIEFYIPTRDHDRRLAIARITWDMEQVLGYRIDQKHGGLVVGGCGMDMGFHCVYSLGRRLWPKGTRTPHGTRNGTSDREGGYALKSRQM